MPGAFAFTAGNIFETLVGLILDFTGMQRDDERAQELMAALGTLTNDQLEAQMRSIAEQNQSFADAVRRVEGGEALLATPDVFERTQEEFDTSFGEATTNAEELRAAADAAQETLANTQPGGGRIIEARRALEEANAAALEAEQAAFQIEQQGRGQLVTAGQEAQGAVTGNIETNQQLAEEQFRRLSELNAAQGTEAQADLAASRERELGSLSTSFREEMDAINRQNQGAVGIINPLNESQRRLSSELGERELALLEGAGDQERRDIRRAGVVGQGTAIQDLALAGFSNTTLRAGARQGVRRETAGELGRLNERIRQEALAATTQAGERNIGADLAGGQRSLTQRNRAGDQRLSLQERIQNRSLDTQARQEQERLGAGAFRRERDFAAESQFGQRIGRDTRQSQADLLDIELERGSAIGRRFSDLAVIDPRTIANIKAVG